MRRSPLLPIFLVVVVDILGLTIMLPLLPFYAEHFGASPAVVGLLVAAYALCQLVAGPPLGSLSDQLGRKPVLIVSQLGTFVGFLILAAANSLWMVFAARIIDGLTAGNLSIAQAYIADVTAPKERARSFAVIGIAFGIGFLVGPGLSGYLSAHFGYHVPILCAAGLSLTSIFGTTFLLPAVPPHPEGEHVPAAPLGPPQEEEAPVAPGGKRLRLLDWSNYVQYFRRPVLGGLLWEFFLFTFAFATFTGGFALFAERRFAWHGHAFGVKEVGYVFTYSGLLGIVVQGSMRSGWPVRVFGEVRLVTLGFVSGVVGYTLLGLSHGIALLLVAATFASLGNGLIRPALTSLITQQVGRGEQGVVLGLTQSLMSVAQIVGPAIAGALIDRGWLAAWAFSAALITVVALVLNHNAREARHAAAADQLERA
ncbi:MAG TPA: MFS transporter [Myxococcales bacterium]|jgi:MFS family permease|nr:MFS transporter [Myxococcales bacterium]